MSTAVQPTVAPTVAPTNTPASVLPASQTPPTPAPSAAELPAGVSGMIERITRKAVPADTPDASTINPSAAPTNPATDITAASAGGSGTPVPPSDASADPGAALPADGVSSSPDLTDPTLAPPIETPTQMVNAITADEPEGEVVLRARDPQTGQFSDMDQTRVYELSIKDKTTGETRVYNKTLPDLMRMAKDGVASRQLMQTTKDELSYYREQIPAWQETHTQLASEAEGYKALAIELLTADEGLVVARREAYAAEQTPEKELARLRARMAQQEQQHQQTAQERAVQQQIVALGSRISATVQHAQNQVGMEAAAGKLAIDTAQWMEHGRIAPRFFPQFEAYIQGPFRQWAEGEAGKRAQATSAADKERQAAQQAARLAQQRAQQAVNGATAPLKPGGALQSGAQPPQGKPRNVSDAISRIVSGNGRPVAGAA